MKEDVAPTPKAISRRSFLKGGLLGLGAAGAAAIKHSYEHGTAKLIADGLSKMVEFEQGLKDFLRAIERIGHTYSSNRLERGHSELERNHDFVPAFQILKEAVATYGKPVDYNFDSSAKINPTPFKRLAFVEVGKWKFTDIADVAQGGDWPLENGLSTRDKLWKFLLDEYSVSIEEHSVPALEYGSFASSFSGIARRAFEMEIPEGISFSQAVSRQMQEVVSWVVSQPQQISSAQLLAYFLNLSHGNLRLAISDCYLFTKAAARNNLLTGLPLTGGHYGFDQSSGFDNINMGVWRNYTDDRSVRGRMYGIPYADENSLDYDHPEKDLSVVNRIGVTYHFFGMLELLGKLHPDIVGLLGATNTLAEVSAQGGNKVSSDAVTALELGGVVQLLTSYSPS